MRRWTGKVTFDVDFTDKIIQDSADEIMHLFIDKLAEVYTANLDLVWDNVEWTIEETTDEN